MIIVNNHVSIETPSRTADQMAHNQANQTISQSTAHLCSHLGHGIDASSDAGRLAGNSTLEVLTAASKQVLLKNNYCHGYKHLGERRDRRESDL